MAVKKPSPRSRAAKASARVKKEVDTTLTAVPMKGGEPMVQISVAATELVPTGDYASVTVGPVVVTKFIVDQPGEEMVETLNELCEVVEQCVAEQREIVNASLKSSVESK